MKRLIMILALLSVAIGAGAQDVAGRWYGALNVGGAKLRLLVEIEHEASVYAGAMTSIDQMNMKIPFDRITFAEGTLSFGMSSLGAAFEGKLTDEGTIKGTFTQNGMALPLTLTRDETTVAVSRPQEPKPPYPYLSEEVTFRNEQAGIELAGTLTRPKEGKAMAAVILVSGSGAQDRDESVLGHKPFLVLADYLTRGGIAVLRYDDRGVGQSGGVYATATMDSLADDARAALRYLKSRNDIDTQIFGAIGHSEGGSIAFKLAAAGETDLIVSLAGPGVRGDSLLSLQRAAIMRAQGADEAYITNYNAIMDAATELALKAKDEAELKASLDKLFEGTIFAGQSDKVAEQFAAPGLRSILRYDPATDLRNIKCPMLALFGSKDVQVPAAENSEGIKRNTTDNRDVEVITYEGLNHLFQHAATGLPQEYSTNTETISPEVLRGILSWFSLYGTER
jgi:pimeloyl-ACP methyl ester carboxylesterase